MAKLLVVEDDDGIRTILRMAMEDEGYQVFEAPSAESALFALGREEPDAMVVDLMLGGMDGFTFIKEARAHSQAPIIVVSALADTSDIVTALENGADDYVTKPFKVEEVAARLRALRRRAPGADQQPAQRTSAVVLDAATDLVLDTEAGAVRRGGEDIHLTTTEYRLICELAAPAGRVMSRQVLLERVWDRGYFGDDRIVDVHIRRLRMKVERDAGDPRLVVTVRGQGYRLDLH